MRDILAKAALVQLVIFDVDGVLTDGRLYLSSDGSEMKAFHVRDGHGIKMLLAVGVEVALISAGRNTVAVERRMSDLGIRHAYLGVQDKLAAFDSLRTQLALEHERIAYVGDDLIDLPVMTRVGLAIAVADADPFVKRHAHWQTANRGGRGAVRDVCELLLEAHGQLDSQRARYL
ncbi:MAG: 3-deoxy-manno-octulosonate-8-phosphatase KdsC [Candidatus Competibacter denitrificans]|jgi:3-deoxy-D-manno-octulosonate 8-phosphate phosphatase (KDO 8-P phosphatase)|uniref:3-deoxy-D-manno-octulosonate 8-phosphate phosphatase KdsC n=1 Tax=Candidatus Competibacter denitrificans Run_A_D11 TaxID=1400863 RepID=W6M6G9_9GAMM|nr:3-deoxy-manno-octulosonate-8-phosphatase KdsC [Candidatus Competibacter denitrificans]CDI01325.1 3-deoxy-D-manno-octulosonate 8-phosphate phosphatase, KDO biosynthesis (E. coli B strain) [Candidatus Competibacter denitrificans Run_A_D11]HAS86201.1 3-deoxy-manno-octulosonate-8-phosphatase KdsC [Candidatus Competibacteraceae bacterium]HRC68216.1 3-deoxy-manno-octulosonate-8-phosphatase KdsC [Candidatus Competibacter denitrificans]